MLIHCFGLSDDMAPASRGPDSVTIRRQQERKTGNGARLLKCGPSLANAPRKIGDRFFHREQWNLKMGSLCFGCDNVLRGQWEMQALITGAIRFFLLEFVEICARIQENLRLKQDLPEPMLILI